MSTKTKRRLSGLADGLEAVVKVSIKGLVWAVELVMIDFVFGKGKYRKRGPKPRPIIHRTYVRNIRVSEKVARRELANDLMNSRR